MTTTRDLTEANSAAGAGAVKYVTAGADLAGASPETGYVPVLEGEEGIRPSDSNGDTYVGDPYNPPHGFLTRPQGWER